MPNEPQVYAIIHSAQKICLSINGVAHMLYFDEDGSFVKAERTDESWQPVPTEETWNFCEPQYPLGTQGCNDTSSTE